MRAAGCWRRQLKPNKEQQRLKRKPLSREKLPLFSRPKPQGWLLKLLKWPKQLPELKRRRPKKLPDWWQRRLRLPRQLPWLK